MMISNPILAFTAAIGGGLAAGSLYGQNQSNLSKKFPVLNIRPSDILDMVMGKVQPDRNLEEEDEPPTINNIDLGTTEMSGQGGPSLPSSFGDANSLPAVQTFNPDNFYLLYSKIQYNVI